MTASKSTKTDKMPASAQEHAATFTNKQRTIALVIVAFAFVMDLLDSTIVNVAIPTIRTNLHASYSAIQWIVAGYSLAFSLLLITGGRMGDVFGYKKLFMVGVGGFTLASLLSGVSTDSAMLIIARILQGSMASLMVPQVMSLMQVMYKPEERGSINGLFGALGGLAASLGPVVGGLLIKANIAGLDWRPIFLINIPIGLFALFVGFKYLPNGKSSHPLKLDLVGTGLVMVALFLLVFPLIQGRQYGWPDWTYIMMVISLPFLGLFAWWQRYKDRVDGSPLVLPALFKNRSFGIGLAVNAIFEMAMIGFFLTFTLFLQIGLGFSAVHAALTGIPTAVAIAMTMATTGETLIPKMGRYALSFGAVVMATGLAITALIFHHYGQGTHSWQLAGGLFLVGVGMGFSFGSLFAAVLNGVDASHAGSASGVLNAVQQVGGAIGVALIGVIFFGQLSHAAPNSFTVIEPQLRRELTIQHVPDTVQAEIVTTTRNCYVDTTREQDASVTPKSCQFPQGDGSDQALAAQLMYQFDGSQLKAYSLQANATNFDHAFRWSMAYDIVLLTLTFGLSFGLPKRIKREAFEAAA